MILSTVCAQCGAARLNCDQRSLYTAYSSTRFSVKSFHIFFAAAAAVDVVAIVVIALSFYFS